MKRFLSKALSRSLIWKLYQVLDRSVVTYETWRLKKECSACSTVESLDAGFVVIINNRE